MQYTSLLGRFQLIGLLLENKQAGPIETELWEYDLLGEVGLFE